MQCDMCGKETNLSIALIEGTEMQVCDQCAKFGKTIKRIEPEPKIRKRRRKKKEELGEVMKERPKKEVIQIINPDYGNIIKQKRESIGLKQEEFAKKINEKISLIHKVEIGNFEPSIALARKIERFLKVKLIEQYEEEHGKLRKIESDKLTIGDLLKFRG